MTETLACHHILNIIDEIICIEGDQLLSLHEIADRHTLVNETGCRVGIIRSCDDGTAALLCQFFDRHGNASALTHDDTACTHLDRAQLRLIAVAEDNQVVLFNIIFHHIRISCRNQDFSFIKVLFLIANKNRALQGLDDICILGACLGKNAAVVYIHIRTGDIADCDQTFQYILIGNSRKCYQTVLLHQVPCFSQGNILGNTWRLADLNILDLRFDGFNQFRHIYLKVIQYEGCLRVQFSGTARYIFAARLKCFEIRIADCRTNRIRIRVFMSNYNRFLCFFCCHFFLLIRTVRCKFCHFSFYPLF